MPKGNEAILLRHVLIVSDFANKVFGRKLPTLSEILKMCDKAWQWTKSSLQNQTSFEKFVRMSYLISIKNGVH